MLHAEPLEVAELRTVHSPIASETRQERRERYEAIASALAVVTHTEKPIYLGKQARWASAALVLAITRHESRWDRDVDLGLSRGDNGASWCLGQINLGPRGRINGWSGQDLVEDRERCLRVTFQLARRSFGMCKRLLVAERLAAYASGSCDRGRKVSRDMVTHGWHLLSRMTRPW
jgi:hypothetical protein